MSHNVDLKGVKLKDTTALKKACEELAAEGSKIKLDMTAKTFRTYSGQNNKCDGAIIMDGPHDIGLKKQADGSYQPVFDPYGFSPALASDRSAEAFCPVPTGDQGHAQRMIGKLLQRYGVCITEREAAMQGKNFTRTTDQKSGVVELTISA